MTETNVTGAGAGGKHDSRLQACSKPNDELAPKPSSSDAPIASDLRLIATAYHEAGHAVMALALGRPIQKITIAPGKMQTGGVRLGACEIKKGRFKASQDWLEDELLILLAGMVAESKLTEIYCEQGAAQDLRNARRMMATRATSQRQLERLERRLLDKTEHLLSAGGHAKAIELIAAELVEKTTISGRAARHWFDMSMQQFS